MKVKDLIKELQKYDPERPVKVDSEYWGCSVDIKYINNCKDENDDEVDIIVDLQGT